MAADSSAVGCRERVARNSHSTCAAPPRWPATARTTWAPTCAAWWTLAASGYSAILCRIFQFREIMSIVPVAGLICTMWTGLVIFS